MKSKYLFFALPLLTFLFNEKILADERAPKGKCYLGIGFVNGKSQVEDYAKKSGYDPSKFEIFERNDKKLYFTFGKIDEKLFKRNKSDGYLDDKFFCASGKGYLRRFNLTSEYKIIKGSKRFLDYQSDLQAALQPYTNSINLTKEQNEESLVNETPKKDTQSLPLTSNNIEIDFGSSSYGMILNNQAEGLISFKIYLDKLIQSTKNSSNITNFSDSKSQKASFSFGIFKNLKYEGYLKDLSGNLVLNPNAKPKIVMLQIPSKAITNPEYSCCEDGSEAQIFIDALIEFNKYAILFDSTFEWGVKELRNLYPATKPLNTKFKYDPFISIYDSKKSSNRYYEGSKWNTKSKQWNNCFENVNFKETLYIFAPIPCMQYYDLVSKKVLTWSWGDNGEFELIKETNNLTTWNSPFEKELNNLKRMAKEFKNNSQNSFVTFKVDSKSSKICLVNQNDDNKNKQIILHTANTFSYGNKSKLIDLNSSKKIFSDINTFYLEISQIKSEDCGIVSMNLENFAQISEPMNDLKYTLANQNIVNNFFNKDDIQESFIYAYDGLTPQEISSFEVISSMKVTPKNAKFFKTLENQFNTNGVLFSKNNFEIYKGTAMEIYGNSYISNIISLLKYSAEISLKGIDITDESVKKSMKNNFDNKSYLKNEDRIKIYHDLITNFNLSLKEIDALFYSINLIQEGGLYKNISFAKNLDFYTDIIRESKGMNDSSNIVLKESISIDITSSESSIDKYILKILNEKQKKIEQRREVERLAKLEENRLIAAKKEVERLAKLEENRLIAAKKADFARKYPIKVKITCDMRGNPMNVGHCFMGSGKYSSDSELRINENGNSYEVSGLDLFRRSSTIWEKDISNGSCSITAQKSNDDIFVLKLEAISNLTGKTVQTKSCSSSYCVVSVRC